MQAGCRGFDSLWVHQNLEYLQQSKSNLFEQGRYRFESGPFHHLWDGSLMVKCKGKQYSVEIRGIMKVFIGDYPEGDEERKVEVEIHNYDIWSTHNTLSLIIQPLLEKFREKLHGAPFVDDEDVPEELKSSISEEDKNNGKLDDNHFKRWDYVLDEMIHAFRCDNDPEWENQFYSGEVDFDFEKCEDSENYQLVSGPNHTFKVDDEAMKVAWERRSNGLRLFGKYYHNLWD